MQSVRWDDRDGARWIQLRGELDNLGYQKVSARFFEAARGADIVIVDMSGVKFVSSNGVRLLLAAHQQLRPRGGRLYVTGLQPGVRKVFNTIRIFEAIPEYAGTVLDHEPEPEADADDAPALS